MSGGDGIFRIRRGPDEGHHVSASVGVLSKADLDKPCCGACYRPLAAGEVIDKAMPGYCRRCVMSGAARRHQGRHR